MTLSSNKSPEFSLRQQAIEWLVLLRSDDFDEKDMVAFASWLAQDHAHSEAFSAVENLFDDMALAAVTPAPDTVTTLNFNKPEVSLSHSQKPPAKRLSVRSAFSWMAVSLALASLCLFIVTLIKPPDSQLLSNFISDYHTGTGELREIQLADNSRLLLNTNSAISIDLNSQSRLITLHTGQVRFTVAEDVNRPFEVISDDLIIRALGTVFEVYKRANIITVTVQEHAIEAKVLPSAENATAPISSTIKVKQGQQLNFHLGDSLLKPQIVELNQTSAWQQRKLLINDRPLQELIDELGRYRAGRVFISDNRLKNLRVTGVFSLDNPDEVLDSVRKVLNLKATRLGPWWVLLHR